MFRISDTPRPAGASELLLGLRQLAEADVRAGNNNADEHTPSGLLESVE